MNSNINLFRMKSEEGWDYKIVKKFGQQRLSYFEDLEESVEGSNEVSSQVK